MRLLWAMLFALGVVLGVGVGVGLLYGIIQLLASLCEWMLTLTPVQATLCVAGAGFVILSSIFYYFAPAFVTLQKETKE